MKRDLIRDTQLANVIAEEVGYLLHSARDSRLTELVVARVDAKPGGRHFVVYLACERDIAPFRSREEMKQVLKRAVGYLRSELALSLHLKRIPDITLLPDPGCRFCL